ncbi:hypothetical protein [Photobacterium toruni]|uniref:hypothetical protein n=1 Tax=Photobacterium toruni TaxID=1935446 RepID=UPI00210FB4FC|nr:hypothetical protein [Photobacterium toruni]
MKSLEELIKIKAYCKKKQARFQEGSPEYIRQATHITSLEKQIEEEKQIEDQRGGWSHWDEVSDGDGDGYLGDGVYASNYDPN